MNISFDRVIPCLCVLYTHTYTHTHTHTHTHGLYTFESGSKLPLPYHVISYYSSFSLIVHLSHCPSYCHLNKALSFLWDFIFVITLPGAIFLQLFAKFTLSFYSGNLFNYHHSKESLLHILYKIAPLLLLILLF